MKNKMFWIKLPYWLGILADAIWAIALFLPSVFGKLTGYADFNPDLQVRLIMGIAGSLMTGWTLLLVWGIINPVKRRVVGLLTAFPVITGLFIVTIIGKSGGNSATIWILLKLLILAALFVTSYSLAKKADKKVT